MPEKRSYNISSPPKHLQRMFNSLDFKIELLSNVFLGPPPQGNNFGTPPPPPPPNQQQPPPTSQPPAPQQPQQTPWGQAPPTGYPQQQQWPQQYYNPYQQAIQSYNAPPPPWVRKYKCRKGLPL